jgi:uncharacterized protein (DUF362 family)
VREDKRSQDASPPRLYTRREVIARVATTTSLAAASVGLGGWLVGRTPRASAAAVSIRDHRIARAAGDVDLVIARGPDAATNVRQALQALGGIERFVRSGERVVVKPNVGWNRLPEQAANTNPEVVAEIVRQCRAAGAAVVWVTDVSVNNPGRSFERSGIAAAARAAGAKVVLPDSGSFRLVMLNGRLLHEAEVLWPLVEADRVVNVPVAKHHGLTGVTLGLKNWIGVLGGQRARLHQHIEQVLVDLSRMMRPTLTVLDGTRVLLANGPTGGSLDDVRRADTIIAGVDDVAVDAAGASLLGRTAEELPYLAVAEQAGLGHTDYRSLKLVEVSG